MPTEEADTFPRYRLCGVDIRVLDLAAGGVEAAGRTPRPAVPQGSDPVLYAVNPLLEEMRRDRPALVTAAMAEDPTPPRLFGDRDLPAFTASGLDPAQLAALPWPLRRPVAAAPILAAAYDLAGSAAVTAPAPGAAPGRAG